MKETKLSAPLLYPNFSSLSEPYINDIILAKVILIIKLIL